jgi:LmbE family N-acetylglucosaminyl deacetylase
LVINQKRILAIGAHPDDIELGCGGTLHRAILNGQRIVAVYLTKGERSGEPKIRMKESKKALSILGVTEVHFENFPDAEIPESFEAIECLEKYAVDIKPGVVLTHSTNDIHQDHRRVGWISMAAFRNIPVILAYETPRVRSTSFAPNYFVDITGLTDKKYAALHCHKSQGSKRYLLYDSTVNLASFRGSQVGVKEAEAFEVVKFLEI